MAKTRNKIVRCLMAFMLLLPFLSGIMSMRVNAAATFYPTPGSGRVNLYVHKKDVTGLNISDDSFQNTGAVLTNNLGKAPGINGITFELRDMSDLYYGLREGTKKIENGIIVDVNDNDALIIPDEDAYNLLVNFIKNKPASFFDEYENITEATTETNPPGYPTEDGVARFMNIPQESNGRAAIYAIVETKNESGKSFTESVNTVLALPVYGSDNKELSIIHIYPKNKTANIQKDLVRIDRVFGDNVEIPKGNTGNFPVSVGDVMTYEVTFDLPSNLTEDVTVYEVFPDGLAYNDGSAKYKFDGIEEAIAIENVQTGTYLPDTKEWTRDSGQNLRFILSRDELQSAGDKKITLELELTFVSSLDENFDPDALLVNEAYVKINGVTDGDDSVGVVSGGYRFQKVDDAGTGLAGATFELFYGDPTAPRSSWAPINISKVEDPVGWIGLSEGLEDYDLYQPDQESDSNEITTTGSGQFALIGTGSSSGFQNGTYFLVEKTPPPGYIRLANPIKFTVLSEKIDDNVSEGTLDIGGTSSEIINFLHTGALPMTSGVGMISFLAIGLTGLVVTVYLYIRHRRSGNTPMNVK